MLDCFGLRHHGHGGNGDVSPVHNGQRSSTKRVWGIDRNLARARTLGAPCCFRAGAGGSVLASAGAGYVIPGSLSGGSGLGAWFVRWPPSEPPKGRSKRARGRGEGSSLRPHVPGLARIAGLWPETHALRSTRGCSCSSWPNRVGAQPREPTTAVPRLHWRPLKGPLTVPGECCERCP